MNNYASFLFKDASESARWGDGWFEGTRRGSSYPIPVGVRNREGDQARSEVLPDFTQLGLRPIPTFSQRAVDSLGAVLREHGELAPIQMSELVQYFGFNPTTIVDVLDEKKSQIKRFTDGEVMRVERHVLLDSVTSLPPIFKIPQTRRNTTYVNEMFVGLVQEKGLTGFRFEVLFQR
ncbi:hypothetical protein JJ685_18000 [Ramlibacter monticola]|uniref:Uncharacterized protein n=1 Tax=Ramlibacter monticola TaxID=1926872 RepID=A0A936Z3N2_9BURK|nr:hypothetical protein [Ramlibacter monticola]MBL0393037.1 hypothetical protein [Ramlibacter monticola]